MMFIDNMFELGETVYLKTDDEQKPRIVVRFYVTSNGITYGLACGTEETNHFYNEISIEKNILV